MAEETGIEWTDATFNPWVGCTKVSPGCDHCYAEARMDTRLHIVQWGAGAPRKRTSAKNWRGPRSWNDEADAFEAAHGRRRRVFCASLADVFDNEVDITWRADLLELIRETPRLDWLLLTKRIGNVKKMLAECLAWAQERSDCGELANWLANWVDGDEPANVWLGASIVDQQEADRDIPKLLATPARVRFLSMEPLLGPVDLTAHLWGRTQPCLSCPKDADCACGYEPRARIEGEPCIRWVIVGGESGHRARPMHPDWVRGLGVQCENAAVPFLFKQWGEWVRWVPGLRGSIVHVSERDGASGDFGGGPGYVHDPQTDELVIRADTVPMVHVGKKAAGRLLDGRTYDGYPADAPALA